MAFGQIDPARLDGDALRGWYLRTPADIEQERQQAAAQRYRDFFGSSDPDNLDRGPATSSSGSLHQVAATTPTDFWDDWTPCTSGQCHRDRWPPETPASSGATSTPW